VISKNTTSSSQQKGQRRPLSRRCVHPGDGLCRWWGRRKRPTRIQQEPPLHLKVQSVSTGSKRF
jgi:hypothetical protein